MKSIKLVWAWARFIVWFIGYAIYQNLRMVYEKEPAYGLHNLRKVYEKEDEEESK